MAPEMLSKEDAFELQLVRQDLLSDALFLIGTFISIWQNKEAEQKIIDPGENQPSLINTAPAAEPHFGLGPIVLILFLAGTSILANAAIERLNKQKAEAANITDQTTAINIKGSEIIILGQLVRIIGYIISIIGSNIESVNPV